MVLATMSTLSSYSPLVDVTGDEENLTSHLLASTKAMTVDCLEEKFCPPLATCLLAQGELVLLTKSSKIAFAHQRFHDVPFGVAAHVRRVMCQSSAVTSSFEEECYGYSCHRRLAQHCDAEVMIDLLRTHLGLHAALRRADSDEDPALSLKEETFSYLGL